MTACASTCDTQCDDCHDLDNCVPADTQYGDLLLCDECRKKYPSGQPWHIDPETGDIVDHALRNGVWVRPNPW